MEVVEPELTEEEFSKNVTPIVQVGLAGNGCLFLISSSVSKETETLHL